jgi:apolipoprotein N-acyltransferase
MLKYRMFSYKSILTALFFSFFIYSEYFGISVKSLNTVFAIMGIFSLFILTKKELFLSGFLISILWFWWIGNSFIYYDLSYLIPVVLIGISFCYGLFFYFIGFYNNLVYKLVYIFALSFFNPFNFNWFKLELPFINSYFGTSKVEFLIILITLALFLRYQSKYKKQSLAFLICSFLGLYLYNTTTSITIEQPNLKIYKYNTYIDQDKKWEKSYKNKTINENIKVIKKAIDGKYDLIVLPETAFPLVLNRNNTINDILLELSYEISIVTGSLYEKDGLYYNSTYFYENGKREVAHKVVLVPFGEAVPMPEKIRNFINDIFYNGAKDYETAKEPTTFNIQGVKFRNAICYEITTDEIYKNLDTPYIIGTSNNAWFTPSTEPTLQKLLMKYYEKKYNLYYIDVSNTSDNEK